MLLAEKLFAGEGGVGGQEDAACPCGSPSVFTIKQRPKEQDSGGSGEHGRQAQATSRRMPQPKYGGAQPYFQRSGVFSAPAYDISIIGSR